MPSYGIFVSLYSERGKAIASLLHSINADVISMPHSCNFSFLRQLSNFCNNPFCSHSGAHCGELAFKTLNLSDLTFLFIYLTLPFQERVIVILCSSRKRWTSAAIGAQLLCYCERYMVSCISNVRYLVFFIPQLSLLRCIWNSRSFPGFNLDGPPFKTPIPLGATPSLRNSISGNTSTPIRAKR